ncbi:MAG: YdcF family protein [Lachnospiraceae bacterium]|nr:YdcF family protein [Lachnospiraceae bacterium]
MVICGVLFAIGLVGGLGLNVYVKHFASPYIFRTGNESDIPEADCILVLGAGVKPDGTPSLMLTDRLNRALELYEAGVADRFLMTGDHGRENYNEVQAMKDYVMAAGVPEDKIFMDHAGFSTYESMYRARDVFDVEHPVIVTQPYHSYRAVYAARKLGLDACAAPNKRDKYTKSWIFGLREIAARDKEFVTLILQPKPTYLGDKIPITGSGLATKD